MPLALHDGLKISYEEVGSGEPVLFLAGTTTDSSIWLTGAGTYLEGFRSIMVDPRDTPKSSEASSPYTPADLAREALAVLDAAGVSEAHVVGYSLGGAVAQEFAIASPERTRSLTLVSTWARTDPWLRHVFEWLRDGLLAAGMDWGDRAVAWLVLSPEWQEEPMYGATLLFMNARGQSVEALTRQLECDISHDALARLPSISLKTLVICGSEDRWIPPRYSRQLAQVIPGAKLEIFEGGEHAFLIENPEEFFTLLRSHLDSSPAG
jgi:pimeloyl-ACP methyl ester carboxylesterase